ncbi:MAG TPA: TetR/AcrR family transcriptional regulator [Thermoplasmata archaeon]|nr:TetR/AcrR family transcriptional regulator [Thermoplasmata archaeon]
MVVSAALLLGSRGAGETSLSDVLERSQAPRGSIYHHFPAGKRELLQEAMRWTTNQVLSYQRRCTARTPADVLEHFVDFFRQSMISSRCESGCPVAGVLIDTHDAADPLQRTGRSSFRSWARLLAKQLEEAGTPPRRAPTLGWMTLASVEGALILCRAEGSVRPLEIVAEQLRLLATPHPRRSR